MSSPNKHQATLQGLDDTDYSLDVFAPDFSASHDLQLQGLGLLTNPRSV